MIDRKDRQVSFDDEMLILVNRDDQEIGYLDKRMCHLEQGVLHRAFSIFIFNGRGEILMQKRSHQKTLWPLFWSNSCCSHPRKGEKLETSTRRRLQEELGIATNLKFLYKFNYQAPYLDVGAENELCHVYVGYSDAPVKTNVNEIAEWKYFDVTELDRVVQEQPRLFTPWFRMEWEKIRNEHWETVQGIIARI